MIIRVTVGGTSSLQTLMTEDIITPTGNPRKTRGQTKLSITREKEISKKEKNNISPVTPRG